MNKQILTTFTAILFALAITGYAYSHWQETLQIQGTAEMAKLEITIQNCNTPLQILHQNSHNLELNGTINPNQPIITEITIKNTGTTPATITHQISTNNTTLWNTYFSYSQNLTTPYELASGNSVPIKQNITLTDTPPAFTIEIISTYTATFQSWTDTVTIKYTLTHRPAETQNTNDQSTPDSGESAETNEFVEGTEADNQTPDSYDGENPEADNQNNEALPSNNNDENTSQETTGETTSGNEAESTVENNSESAGGEDTTENGET